MASDEVKWERGNSGFDRTLLGYSAKRLIPLGHGSDVLDIGCNDGMFTSKLCDSYDYVIGIDSSASCIGKAKHSAPHADFYTVSIEEFIPPHLFDSIYMLNVLEHVTDPVAVISRIGQWLTLDGCLIIQVPNALSMNRRIGYRMHLVDSLYSLSARDVEVGHRRFYDMNRLIRDVCAGGLIVESSGSIFFKPFTNHQMDYFVSRCLKTEDMREKFCDACYSLAEELPDYSSPIWVKCIKDASLERKV